MPSWLDYLAVKCDICLLIHETADCPFAAEDGEPEKFPTEQKGP